MACKPYRCTVANYHLDGYGHVNNARYLEFLEAARWSFFAQQGLQDVLRQARLVVVRIDIRYRRAAVLDDVLDIICEIQTVKSRQLCLRQIVQCAGRTVAEADVTLSATDAAGNMVRLPDALTRFLLKDK